MADKRYMGLKYLFDRKKKSYYNIGFVFDEVPNKLLPFDYETISTGQNRKALLSGWRNRRFYPIPACFGGGLRQTDRRAYQRAWLCEND